MSTRLLDVHDNFRDALNGVINKIFKGLMIT